VPGSNYPISEDGESIEGAALHRFKGEGELKMRSYLLSGACAASLMLALTPVAQAADIDMAPEPMGPAWYVSVFGGWSIPKDENVLFEDTTAATPVTFDADIDLDDGFMAGLAVGAHLSHWLRAEAEISGHWHDAAGEAELMSVALVGSPPVAVAATTEFDLDGEEDALFVLANLWVDLPFGDTFRPYVGGGFGAGRVTLELEGVDTAAPSTPVEIIDDSDWGFAWQVGAGVAFGFMDNFVIDVGYRYKRIDSLEFELEDDITGGAEGIHVEKDYKSHNILAGIRFGF
jgi:OOP family OmpA-OmpF porin